MLIHFSEFSSDVPLCCSLKARKLVIGTLETALNSSESIQTNTVSLHNNPNLRRVSREPAQSLSLSFTTWGTMIGTSSTQCVIQKCIKVSIHTGSPTRKFLIDSTNNIGKLSIPYVKKEFWALFNVKLQSQLIVKHHNNDVTNLSESDPTKPEYHCTKPENHCRKPDSKAKNSLYKARILAFVGHIHTDWMSHIRHTTDCVP